MSPNLPAPPPLPALGVLVVDDNADVANSLATILRIWGHEVRTAPDGAAALLAAPEFAPDLGLLDLAMPRTDGCELARQLRKLPGLAELTLVAMTGYADEEHRQRSAEAGFSFYFVKPADLEELGALLRVLAREKAKAESG
jgi:two-component system CheB/CheR fusion protein